jgi:hypothetical protein
VYNDKKGCQAVNTKEAATFATLAILAIQNLNLLEIGCQKASD